MIAQGPDQWWEVEPAPGVGSRAFSVRGGGCPGEIVRIGLFERAGDPYPVVATPAPDPGGTWAATFTVGTDALPSAAAEVAYLLARCQPEADSPLGFVYDDLPLIDLGTGVPHATPVTTSPEPAPGPAPAQLVAPTFAG